MAKEQEQEVEYGKLHAPEKPIRPQEQAHDQKKSSVEQNNAIINEEITSAISLDSRQGLSEDTDVSIY